MITFCIKKSKGKDMLIFNSQFSIFKLSINETMKYDFDKAINRRGTNCVKWDVAKEETGVILMGWPTWILK